eukprot:Clim_evm20s144 gene=Clim_evmTU20s144
MGHSKVVRKELEKEPDPEEELLRKISKDIRKKVEEKKRPIRTSLHTGDFSTIVSEVSRAPTVTREKKLLKKEENLLKNELLELSDAINQRESLEEVYRELDLSKSWVKHIVAQARERRHDENKRFRELCDVLELDEEDILRPGSKWDYTRGCENEAVLHEYLSQGMKTRVVQGGSTISYGDGYVEEADIDDIDGQGQEKIVAVARPRLPVSCLADPFRTVLVERPIHSHDREVSEHSRRHLKIGVVGVANAGKSTLVNALLGVKLSITSPFNHTTQDLYRSSLTEGVSQLLFLDTPGMVADDKAKKLGVEKIVASKPRLAMEHADLLLVLIDMESFSNKKKAMRINTAHSHMLRTVKAWQQSSSMARQEHSGDIGVMRQQQYPREAWMVITKTDLAKDPGEVLETQSLVEGSKLSPHFSQTHSLSEYAREGLRALKESLIDYTAHLPAQTNGGWPTPPTEAGDVVPAEYALHIVKETLWQDFEAHYRQYPDALHRTELVQKSWVYNSREQRLGITIDVIVPNTALKSALVGRGGQRAREIEEVASEKMWYSFPELRSCNVYITVVAANKIGGRQGIRNRRVTPMHVVVQE